MPVVRIRYKGKIYVRTVTRNFRGWYIMVSKGKEYWFEKDYDVEENYGWKIRNSEQLDPEFLRQIAPQLEELYRSS